MNPVKIIIEYNNGTKAILEDHVEEWMELMSTLEKIAIQQGIDIKDFNWKEV